MVANGRRPTHKPKLIRDGGAPGVGLRANPQARVAVPLRRLAHLQACRSHCRAMQLSHWRDDDDDDQPWIRWVFAQD